MAEKWIATNIRFPEEMYMELKMEAARRRTSVARIVRERVVRMPQKASPQMLVSKIKRFSQRMAKKYPGTNLSEALIKTRYEQ